MTRPGKITLALAGFMAASFFMSLLPASSSEEKADISIESGWGSKRVARHLKEQGVVRSAFMFRVACALTGRSGRIKAGDFAVPLNLNIWQVSSLLVSGRALQHRFLIKEGLSAQQIADLLEARKLADKARFMSLVKDRALLKKLGVQAPSFEGFLFPDSYQIARGIPEETIIAMMVTRFNEMVPPGLLKRGTDYNLRPLQVLTLASLVEKEAKADDERPKVARVFLNRRRQKKRLESCATIRYALNKYTGPVLYKDLEVDSPYNTYRRYDLPPGPICSPGLKSIQAAAQPATGNWLFFVVAGDGNHVFSETFDEHKNAKTRYKRLRKGVVEE